MDEEQCVEVVVEVLEARDLFEPQDGTESPLPELFVSASFLGQKKDSRDEPSCSTDPLVYKMGIRHSFQYPLSETSREDLISKVLNTLLKLSLHRCDTGMAIATCTVGLEGFLSGVHTIELDKVCLTRVSPPDEQDTYKVAEQGSVGMNICLLKSETVECDLETQEPLEELQTKMIPYTLVAQDQIGNCAIAEFSINSMEGIPQSLLDVNAQLPEGTLQFSVGLGMSKRNVKHSNALCTHEGSLTEDTLSWIRPKKFFLDSAAMKTLRETLEDGEQLPFEIARYVSSDSTGFVDPAFKFYHGATCLDMASLLLQPGVDEFKVQASSFQIASKEEDEQSQMLLNLPAQNSNAKAKPIEAITDTMEQMVCPWFNTSLEFCLRLSRPLVPAWKPPPKPQKTLADIIPKRPVKPPPPPKTASAEFQDEVRELLSSLRAEYDAFEGTEATCAEKRKKLIFELNRSGKYLQIQAKLKVHVERIIGEKYKRKGNLSREVILGLQNDLYVYLMDTAHEAIKPPDKQKPEAPIPDENDLERLLKLAHEYELAESIDAAEKRHQERLVVSNDPEIWYDSAIFYMRTNRFGLAEECFRESLSLQPEHNASILALGCLLLHNSMMTDAAFLVDAEVFIHAAKELEPTSPLVWAIMSIVFEEGGHSQDEIIHVHHEVKRLAQEGVDNGEAFLAANGYYCAAKLMLELRLPYCAERVLKHATGLQGSLGEVEVDLELAEVECAYKKGNISTAKEMLKLWNRKVEETEIRGHLLLGHIHFKGGDLKEALTHYQHALLANVGAFTLEAYIHLAKCFVEMKDWQSACDVYLEGCAHHPCVSLWLGAGISFMRLGDAENGELALSEANILDNRHAVVWGYLALMSLKAGRSEEAKLAMSRAFEEEIKDFELIVEIGQHYMDTGNYRDAQAIFRCLLKIDNSAQAHKLLGNALQEERKYTEARSYYQQALAMAEDGKRITLLEGLIEVNNSLGNIEEAEEYRVELKSLQVKDGEEHSIEEKAVDESHLVDTEADL